MGRASRSRHHCRNCWASSVANSSAHSASLAFFSRLAWVADSRSSTSFKKTFFTWAASGSMSRGTAMSMSKRGRSGRAAMVSLIRSACSTYPGEPVQPMTMSVSRSALDIPSNGTARAERFAASSFARWNVRLVTVMSVTPDRLRTSAASSPASPAPTTNTRLLDRSPNTDLAISTQARLTERAFLLMPVSRRTLRPTRSACWNNWASGPWAVPAVVAAS